MVDRSRLSIPTIGLVAVGMAILTGQALRVSPVIFNLRAPPGVSDTLEVTVRNDEPEPVTVTISFCDWRRDINGANRFCDEAGEVGRSATSWLSASPTQFDLAAEATREVPLEIAVPEVDPEGRPLRGTYWSAAMIEAAPQDADSEDGEGTEIVVKRRFGLKVLVTIAGTGEPRGEVRNLRRRGLNPLWMELEFRNRGNVNLDEVSGRVEIRNARGETVTSIPIEPFPILPGAARRLQIRSERPPGERLPAGDYAAVAILDFGGPNAVGAQRTFAVPELDLAPIDDAEGPPQDLNGDGFYEDVDGDGAFREADPTLLGFALDDPEVRSNWPAFDFDNNGQLNFDDVIALKDRLSDNENSDEGDN